MILLQTSHFGVNRCVCGFMSGRSIPLEMKQSMCCQYFGAGQYDGWLSTHRKRKSYWFPFSISAWFKRHSGQPKWLNLGKDGVYLGIIAQFSSTVKYLAPCLYATDVLLYSSVCPFKHRFRLFTPHLWHSSIGIGAKSFGWLVWRQNLSSSTIGTPGALRQANLWSFMCLSKSCCFSWQNSFWNSKGWTASIFASRRKTIDPRCSTISKPYTFKEFESEGLFPTFLWFGMGDTQLSSSIMGYWQKHEIQVEVFYDGLKALDPNVLGKLQLQ